MPAASITYRRTQTYKYRLEEPYKHDVGIFVSCQSSGGFTSLSYGLDLEGKLDGILRLEAGYRWDGPSGPTFDTPNFMRGALVHDALYQFMREGDLPTSYRKKSDQIIRDICREDGMAWVRACYVYYGLRVGGGKHAKPRKAFPVVTAP